MRFKENLKYFYITILVLFIIGVVQATIQIGGVGNEDIIISSGRIGIGTQNLTQELTVVGAINLSDSVGAKLYLIRDDATITGTAVLGDIFAGGTDADVATSSAALIRIKANGNWNTTQSPTQMAIQLIPQNSSSKIEVFTLTGEGNLTVTSNMRAADFITVSDRDDKTNIKELIKDDVFEKTFPKSYKYNLVINQTIDGKEIILVLDEQVGMMADEVQQAYPECSNGEQVSQYCLVTMLIKEIEQLRDEVKALIAK